MAVFWVFPLAAVIHWPFPCCCGFKHIRKCKSAVILVTKRVNEMDFQSELWGTVIARCRLVWFSLIHTVGNWGVQTNSKRQECELIKPKYAILCTRWRQSPSFCYRNDVFSPSAFGRVKPLVQRKGARVRCDWLLCLFPPFCCYGWHIPSIDAIPTLSQLPLVPPPDISYSIILAPALSLCFKVSFIDSLHFFVSTPLAHTSVYI